MAFATENRALSGLNLEISRGVYTLMSRVADYRAYRRTVAELRALSDHGALDVFCWHGRHIDIQKDRQMQRMLL